MICPRCRSGDSLRSHRGGVADFFGTLLGLRPWRCQACELRFYAWTVAVSFVHYVHCPRCGNFDLQHVARERVADGTLVFLKRFFGFPAYRCDPCRQKFFSLLPYRRIVPSMISDASRKVSVS
jgi:transposase-like protein